MPFTYRGLSREEFRDIPTRNGLSPEQVRMRRITGENRIAPSEPAIVGVETVDSDTAFLTFTVSAAERLEPVEADTALLLLTPDAVETKVSTDAVTTPLLLTPSSTEQRILTDADTASVLFTISSSETKVYTDADTALVLFTPTTAEQRTSTDADTAFAILTPSANEQRVSTDADVASLLLTPSTAERQTVTDADTAILTLTPSGVDVLPGVTPVSITAGAQTNTAGSTSVTATLNASAAIGDTVIVAVWSGQLQGTPAASQITDSGGNTYQLDGVLQNTGAQFISVYSSRITTALASGTGTITFTPINPGQYMRIAACKVAGLATASWLDQVGSAQQDNTDPISATLGGATSQASELLFMAAASQGVLGGPVTVGGSLTAALMDTFGNTGRVLSTGYAVMGSTGTFTGTMTYAADLNDWTAVIVSYKVAVAAVVSTDSGTGLLLFTPSSAEQRISTDADIAVLLLTPSSTDGKVSTDADTAILLLQPSPLLTVEHKESTDAGTAPVVLTPSATEQEVHTDSDTSILTLTPSGTDVYTGAAVYTDAATASVSLTPSATEQRVSADLDTANVVLTPSGTDKQVFVDADTAPVLLTPSATESHVSTDVSTVTLALTPSGADVTVTTDASIVPVALTPSGTDILAKNYTDTNTAIVTFTPSGTDRAQYVDTATVPLIFTVSGVEVLIGIVPTDAATVYLHLTPSAALEALLIYDTLLSGEIRNRFSASFTSVYSGELTGGNWTGSLTGNRFTAKFKPSGFAGKITAHFTGILKRG